MACTHLGGNVHWICYRKGPFSLLLLCPDQSTSFCWPEAKQMGNEASRACEGLRLLTVQPQVPTALWNPSQKQSQVLCLLPAPAGLCAQVAVPMVKKGSTPSPCPAAGRWQPRVSSQGYPRLLVQPAAGPHRGSSIGTGTNNVPFPPLHTGSKEQGIPQQL